MMEIYRFRRRIWSLEGVAIGWETRNSFTMIYNELVPGTRERSERMSNVLLSSAAL
jgi:hypothetical protein